MLAMLAMRKSRDLNYVYLMVAHLYKHMIEAYSSFPFYLIQNTRCTIYPCVLLLINNVRPPYLTHHIFSLIKTLTRSISFQVSEIQSSSGSHLKYRNVLRKLHRLNRYSLAFTFHVLIKHLYESVSPNVPETQAKSVGQLNFVPSVFVFAYTVLLICFFQTKLVQVLLRKQCFFLKKIKIV